MINLTPHVVVINGAEIPPSGQVARCAEISTPAGEVDGLPIVRKEYGDPVGLPDSQPGFYYIVSAMVRLALPERADLFSPGDAIRDADGKIIGVKNLVSN
jgi:hypothetical protein